MLRQGCKHLLTSVVGREPVQLQAVRWRRKPRWLPVAPSKIFRIPERPKQDPEERVELLRLNNNYRTQMRAISIALGEEIDRIEALATSAGSGSEVEASEHARCMAINDEWNRAAAVVRAKRIEEEAKARVERALIGMSRNEAHLAAKAAAIEEIIREEQELAGSYITAANIDEAIEEALANPKDYNYCIDVDGNIFEGSNVFNPTAQLNTASAPQS